MGNTAILQYYELEDLLLESLYSINKNKNFFKNKEKKELFYECALTYCRLKLEKFKDLSINYKNYVSFPSVLKESLGTKHYRLLKEGILDAIGDAASTAYEKVKGWASDAVEHATKSPIEFAQTIGDIVSLFDPTGIVDLINGSVYLARGEYLSAFFCGIAAIFLLPGFISSLTGAGAVAGIPMIVAGKTIKGILKVGGKISEPLLKFAAKILKMGGAAEKMLAIAAKIPGLGKFIEFFKGIIPKFVKAVEEGGKSETILGKVFGTTSDIIKAPGKAAEKLVAKGTELTGEKAAAKIAPHVASSKLGKAFQFGGAGMFASHLIGKKDEEDDEDLEDDEDKENTASNVSDEDIAAAIA